MRFALLQINSTVGAPKENAKKLLEWIDKKKDAASVFVCSELSLVGYPCRDLFSQKKLLEQEKEALGEVLRYTGQESLTIIVGHTSPSPGLKPLYNSASIFSRGKVLGTVHKHRIPSYDVFEEERFFESAPIGPRVFELDGQKIGLQICEDAWNTISGHGIQDIRSYRDALDPHLYLKDADVVVNLSASPFSLGKIATREDLFSSYAQRVNKPFVYVNCVGAHDDLLFDGTSFVMNAKGEKVVSLPSFAESVEVFDSASKSPAVESETISHWESLRQSLVMGIRDYVQKVGSQKVLLGLSGGIDSTLVACLASEALGAGNVLGVTLSSDITSRDSVEDAHQLAKNLGIKLEDHRISGVVMEALSELPQAKGKLTRENLQSRARALLLMAISNESNSLLLATSNKSEIAMGYGTLYGDMCGALMPIGDLLKSEVFGLCHFLNTLDFAAGRKPRIPLRCLTKEPTAELSPGQKDEDSLPPYEKLDVYLSDYLHNAGKLRGDESKWGNFLGGGHTPQSLSRKIQSQEFKRRQAAPILRVHNRAFGQAWHMPIAKGIL